MKNLILLTLLFLLFISCAGTRSYKYSTSTVSVGSNVYFEGGFGKSQFNEDSSDDSLNLEYDEHSTSKFKGSVDLGLKLWDIIISVEAGRVLDDFEKSIRDDSVAGDMRTVEEFKANTNYQRVNLMRRSYFGPPNPNGTIPGFFSFLLYYDYLVDSTFYDLPSSVDRDMRGTGYGVGLGLHMSSLYYNIGYNWRDYENEIKMEEFSINIGMAFLLF